MKLYVILHRLQTCSRHLNSFQKKLAKVAVLHACSQLRPTSTSSQMNLISWSQATAYMLCPLFGFCCVYLCIVEELCPTFEQMRRTRGSLTPAHACRVLSSSSWSSLLISLGSLGCRPVGVHTCIRDK
jgi:hypothetical protein